MDRLNEIRHYIVTKYPDCCMAANYGDVEFSEFEKDLLVKELSDYFWTEHMNLCNCGNPEFCQEKIKRYLEVLKEWTDTDIMPKFEIRQNGFMKNFGIDSVYDDTLLLFLAYVLDSYEFTEHGTSVGGAWITDLGRMYLDVLNEMDFSE